MPLWERPEDQTLLWGPRGRAAPGPGRVGGAVVPPWVGQPVARLLVVQTMTGAGDAIWAARFLPVVARAAPTLTVAATPALAGLLATVPGVTDVVRLTGLQGPVALTGARPDAYVPLVTLPRVLAATPATAPPSGYFALGPRAPLAWPPRRIAFAWRGTAGYTLDPWRRTPLAAWAPLFAATPTVTWLACAPEHRAGLAALAAPNVRDATADGPDWLATARLLTTCDLVVAVDTGLAHLAAALGLPTWVLVGPHRQIYWGPPGARRSPWYPQARLFRPARPRDWAPVIGEVQAALAASGAAPVVA